MKYDLHTPCSNCPFLKEGGIKLRYERIEEISQMMLSSQGGDFPCHKTTKYSEAQDDRVATRKSLHCAGALIYAEKQGTATQLMRISERLGMYDHTKLEGHDLVWDCEEDWLEGGVG
jgi:hypothetical protein